MYNYSALSYFFVTETQTFLEVCSLHVKMNFMKILDLLRFKKCNFLINYIMIAIYVLLYLPFSTHFDHFLLSKQLKNQYSADLFIKIALNITYCCKLTKCDHFNEIKMNIY